MEIQKRTINKGIVSFHGKESRSSHYKLSNDYLFQFDDRIFLCENYIRIPELGIHDKTRISWYGWAGGFGLGYSSVELLKKSGQKVYLHIRGHGVSAILPVEETFTYEAVGLEIEIYQQIEGKKLEFTILDEYKRDFSVNPLYKHNKQNIVSSENLALKLQSDFGKLLSNPINSDIALQCKDGGFLQAHKLILISRCEFFEKMFSSENIESARSIVQCDFKTEIMKTVLEYIYSGKFFENNVYELYEAADYYTINDLKMMCLKVLFQEMNSVNVISILKFAESLNATELKSRALTWITWKAKYVKESKEYCDLVSSALNCESGRLLKLVNEALEVHLQVFDEAAKETV